MYVLPYSLKIGIHLPSIQTIDKPLDRGQFGQVYRATNKADNERIAVRRVPLASLTDEQLSQLIKELKIARGLSHPAFIPVLDVTKDDQYLNIVTAYVMFYPCPRSMRCAQICC